METPTYQIMLVMTKLCEGLPILGLQINSSHLWRSVSASIACHVKNLAMPCWTLCGVKNLCTTQDMAGQKPEIEHLRAGEHGLEMSSKDGHLLLFGCTI